MKAKRQSEQMHLNLASGPGAPHFPGRASQTRLFDPSLADPSGSKKCCGGV
jgi:hypothetical protein